MSRIAIKDERELSKPSRQATASLSVDTGSVGFFDLTAAIEAWIERQNFRDGLLTVFIRHTSASLTVQENADPDVRADLMDAFDRLAPETAPGVTPAKGRTTCPATSRRR
jgi:secondary thiamine-phosphate synthase enzyme